MESQGNSKIAIACGKTGGHIYPGIAIAQSLKKLGIEPFFITEKGFSEQLIKKWGFRTFLIPISPWKRKVFSLNTLGAICSNLCSFLVSLFILMKEKPKVIVGLGGYPSFPPILAGFFLKIPRIIHEQNKRMGLANRLGGKIATKIAISYEDTECAPKQAIFTGCPIRENIGKVSRKEGLSSLSLEDKKTILVMGGSSGSFKINDVFLETLPYLLQFQIIWITGEKDYQRIKDKIKHIACKNKVLVFPFIHEMENAYACSDIIIGRAGAVSIAEIKRCGIPAILIPYPHTFDKHQLKNAQSLKDAIVIPEDRLTKESLQEAITIIKDREKAPVDIEGTERMKQLILEEATRRKSKQNLGRILFCFKNYIQEVHKKWVQKQKRMSLS